MKFGLIARAEDRVCAIEGCDRSVRSRGWCNCHYQRWWVNGDPLQIKNNRGVPVLDRFMKKVTVCESGCWLWGGVVTRGGYGMFWPDETGTPAHRWSYEHHVGLIPQGLQIDHLCRVRRCVNPAHLEPVTAKENQIRSPHNPAIRTHCPQGHAYNHANTYRYPDGRRACRACASVARAVYAAGRRR